MTIAEFLLARIAEDEAVARDVFAYHASPWHITPGPAGWSVIRSAGVVEDDAWGPGGEHDTYVLQLDTSSTAEHIARHDPPRVLADCEAKRRIVDEAHDNAAEIDGEWGCGHSAEQIRTGACGMYCAGPDAVARFVAPLAAVYADHPDYDQAWRP